MSKTLDKINFKEIIENCLDESLKRFQEDYEHDTYSESYPYGDTYVKGRSYIKQSSWDKAQDEWKNNFDINDFITDYVMESQDFRDKVLEMVEELY